MTEPAYQELQWVISGGATPDGQVQIIASKTIDQRRSGLDMKYPNRSRHFDPYYNPYLDPYGEAGWTEWDYREYTLTVGIREFVIVVAPTYQEALQRLFTHWTPPTGGDPLALPQQPASQTPDVEGPR